MARLLASELLEERSSVSPGSVLQRYQAVKGVHVPKELTGAILLGLGPGRL